MRTDCSLAVVSFNAAQSLVGSIPAPPGLGAFEFMALYVSFALVCIPAPRLVVSLGPKLSMALGALPYCGLVVSFLAPGLCTDGQTRDCWSADSIWFVTVPAVERACAPLSASLC